MKKRKRRKARVYKKCPQTHKLYDPYRNLTQARVALRVYPKDAHAIIVKTGESRGKSRAVFPYHIAVSRRWA